MKRTIFFFIFVQIFLFFYSSNILAGEREVVLALSALKQHVEEGVVLSQYDKLLGAAGGQINQLKRARKYTDYNDFIMHANLCLTFFNDAKLFWDCAKLREAGCEESRNYHWERAFNELVKVHNHSK